MLIAGVLWYNKLRGRLVGHGFKFTPYDPCCANKIQNGSQQTVLFHVDALKSSHKDKRVNDEFDKWLQKTYGEHGPVTAHRGKIHQYLGMEIDYSENDKVKFNMSKYVESMLDDFPQKIQEH
jgi:hypothetical protein